MSSDPVNCPLGSESGIIASYQFCTTPFSSNVCSGADTLTNYWDSTVPNSLNALRTEGTTLSTTSSSNPQTIYVQAQFSTNYYIQNKITLEILDYKSSSRRLSVVGAVTTDASLVGTSCATGYLWTEGTLACTTTCASKIPGCSTCTSATVCTACTTANYVPSTFKDSHG